MDPREINGDLPSPGYSLSRRVVKGGVWMLALKIALKVIGLIRLVIVARLLTPSDFGLMGIALLVRSTLETFTQTGFQEALIQKKEDIQSHLNAAWTILILRGLILFTAIYFIAPFTASFFNAPQTKTIVRVIGLSILLRAFTNIGIVFFRKELEFNKQFIYQLSVSLVDSLVAILFAFLLKNVWALVLGWLAGEITGIAVSYFIHPYRPKLELHLGKAKELFNFGKWVLGASIVIFFATQGDDFFLGKVLGVTALGFYQMAFRIGNMPSSEIGGIIGRVTFPAYSKLQTAPQKLREAYLRTVTFSTFLSIPLAGGIVVLAPQFVHIFMGEKWSPIVVPLQILALSGMFRSIAATGGPLFNAIGKPKIGFWLNVVRLAVIVTTIYPLTMLWGIAGTSLSVLLGIAGGCFIWLRASIRETNTRGRDYAAALTPPVAGTLVMGGVMMAVFKTAAFMDNQLIVFLLSIIIGIVAYLGAIFLIQKRSNYGGLKAMRFIVRNIRRRAV